MPRGPNGEKRPGDVVGCAIKTMKVLTGEIEEELPANRGTKVKGGKARPSAMPRPRTLPMRQLRPMGLAMRGRG